MINATGNNMENKVFTYKGQPVTFQSDGDGFMIDATQMARPFGKRPVDWMQNAQSQDFMAELAKVRKSTLADLVQVTRGGNNPGTWMHEDVALEFARWLSPVFAIWCNDRIKELMRHGFTATPETILAILQNPETLIELVRILNEERQKRHAAEKEAAELRPKAQLMDKVLCSDEQIDVGQAAKILSLPYGRNTLFKKLRELGVFFKHRNEPRQEYINKGYFRLKEQWVDRNEHDSFIYLKVLVTQPGLEFLSELLAQNKCADHDRN